MSAEPIVTRVECYTCGGAMTTPALPRSEARAMLEGHRCP